MTFWLKYTSGDLRHRPNTRRGRFYNIRIHPGRFANVLFLCQNDYPIHHLCTAVSWYHCQRIFQEVEPALRMRRFPIGRDSRALAPVTQNGFPPQS